MFHLCHNSAVWLGIATSFIASLVYLAFALCIAAVIRKRRAKPFVGIFVMLDPKTLVPRGGKVSVEDGSSFFNTDTTATLKVSAQHGNGQPDWSGTLEVRGLADIATGFYLHPNRTGGALQFTRVGVDIMEQGNPHDPQYEKFERLLRRQT
jgi:hypothetical protein